MVWMDVCESELTLRKEAAEDTTRPPLVPSEKNNAIPRRTKTTREVSSRYKSAITSHSLSTPSTTRRCPSPNATRTTSSPLFPKRSQSAERRRPSTPPSPPRPSERRRPSTPPSPPRPSERRRPSTPPSPPRPSTPLRDSFAEIHSSSRKSMGGRTGEGLWPSTMRSLTVSFQSDTYSLPVSKKEKPVTHASADHTLKPSVNVVHRQSETPLFQRKTTPERKRTPLRGRNAADQLENSRPVDNLHARAVDQLRWPSRTGGKLSSSALSRSVDLTDKANKINSFPLPGRGVSPLKRTSISDGIGRGMQKSQSEVANRVLSEEIGRIQYERYSGNDSAVQSSGPHKLVSSNVSISSSSSERTSSTFRTPRSQSLPLSGPSRPPSPIKGPLLSSSPSKGQSPSRTRPSSPSKGRCTGTSSVLSFIADVKKGKKGNQIEDAHHLRLLYNRHMQWRYTNARSDAALSVQKITAEKILYNVWTTTSELWDSVTMKRINLRDLRQELKLNSVLNEQMVHLDDWALLEREHSSSLSGAIEALEACTLRLPVTCGSRADIHTLKDAVCSAVDVMQVMGSSICSLLSRVEGVNSLVSELAEVARQEKFALDECGDLLASTVAMQIEENSLRTHLIQVKQTLNKGEVPFSAIETPV